MSFYNSLPVQRTEASLYPTIFEIVSSQEIDELLPSSIRYILTNYWISRYPNWYTIQVNNYFDEWFNFGLKGLIEYYHLKHYNTTFVNKFYGLQKFNSSNKPLLNAQATISDPDFWPKGLQLTTVQKRALLVQSIAVPYLKNKLDELHTKISVITRFSLKNQDDVHVYKLYLTSVFKALYPLLVKATSLLDLIVKLMFVAGKTSSFSLIEYLFNVGNSLMTTQMEKKMTKQTNSNDKRFKLHNYSSMTNSFYTVLNNIWKICAIGGSQIFPTFLFALRVYQWWTTQDLSVQLKKKMENVDEYIEKPTIEHPSTKKSTKNKCPVCHDTIRNPCILETGYVLCYPCAMNYLPSHEGRCPVTKKKLLGCQFDERMNEWKVTDGVRRLLI